MAGAIGDNPRRRSGVSAMRRIPALLALVALLATAPAGAQTPGGGPSPKPDPAPAPAAQATPPADAPAGAKMKEWVRKGSQQKVVELTFDAVDRIEGKVQKPGVDYLITQGDLEYDGLPLERDLLKDLEDSLKGPPF
jgi:hypothetical protein